MKQKGRPQRVILAVDLGAKEPDFVRNLASVLRAYIGARKAVIEPVYVLGPEYTTLVELLANQVGRVEKAVERQLEAFLEGIDLPGRIKPTVLLSDSVSTRGAVKTLLEYAQRTGCQLIAVSSHTRRGLKRFFLGSFAETLSLYSPIPLLVANPRQRCATRTMHSVFFPTDLSGASKEGLDAVGRELKGQKAKLVLFHQFNLIFDLALEPYSYVTIPQSVIDEDFERRRKILLGWAKELEKEGIRSEVILSKRAGPVAEGILAAARRKKVGMIAMVSRSGTVAATMLGSVTRQVMRNAFLPVWVVHPKRKPEQVTRSTENARVRALARVEGRLVAG